MLLKRVKRHTALAACLFALAGCESSNSTDVPTPIDDSTANSVASVDNTGKTDKAVYATNTVAPQALSESDRWVTAMEKSGVIDISEIDNELEKIRHDLIVDRYFEALYSEHINEESIATYYRDHKSQFTSSRVNLAHILIRTRGDASSEELAAANTQAHEILSRLRTGENFAELAAQFSEDKASAKNGGAIGWVEEGGISSAVLKTALAMKAGDVSDPVVEKYGIHILHKLSATENEAKPLKRVRARIVQQLRSDVKQKAIESLAMADPSVREE